MKNKPITSTSWIDDILFRPAVERGAQLCGADLHGADLSGENLREADLSEAYLSKADLHKTDLSWANLTGADLTWADLGEANLHGADLCGADLRGADLRGADLSWCDLRGADLTGAKNVPHLAQVLTQLMPDHELIVGWKKCRDDVLVRLSIPASARRSNATGRKCRAEYVDVLEISGDCEGVSVYDNNVKYRVGERVTCDSWDPDRWAECSGGIHFFLTRVEAQAEIL